MGDRSLSCLSETTISGDVYKIWRDIRSMKRTKGTRRLNGTFHARHIDLDFWRSRNSHWNSRRTHPWDVWLDPRCAMSAVMDSSLPAAEKAHGSMS